MESQNEFGEARDDSKIRNIRKSLHDSSGPKRQWAISFFLKSRKHLGLFWVSFGVETGRNLPKSNRLCTFVERQNISILRDLLEQTELFKQPLNRLLEHRRSTDHLDCSCLNLKGNFGRKVVDRGRKRRKQRNPGHHKGRRYTPARIIGAKSLEKVEHVGVISKLEGKLEKIHFIFEIFEGEKLINVKANVIFTKSKSKKTNSHLKKRILSSVNHFPLLLKSVNKGKMTKTV